MSYFDDNEDRLTGLTPSKEQQILSKKSRNNYIESLKTDKNSFTNNRDIKKTEKKFLWTTKDGDKLIPDQMKTDHIQNCINVMKKRNQPEDKNMLIHMESILETRSSLNSDSNEINKLPSRIFVFGSNLAGRHGKGAALYAKQNYGAEYGVGEGITGQSYAIPTKDENIQRLPLFQISDHVKKFLDFTKNHPELTFEVTKIGTGLAGYKNEEIAPMFFPVPKNCIIDEEWKSILDKKTFSEKLGMLLDKTKEETKQNLATAEKKNSPLDKLAFDVLEQCQQLKEMVTQSSSFDLRTTNNLRAALKGCQIEIRKTIENIPKIENNKSKGKGLE